MWSFALWFAANGSLKGDVLSFNYHSVVQHVEVEYVTS